MTRDLARLAGTTFDVLVVGGGIYGLTIAWEAALRGLDVALIERGDFGAGTSFNSAKTVHGGVRSLQRGALRELREYVRERRALSAIAPHLVHPLAFLMPTYGDPARHRWTMAAYFAAYDWLARDRNELGDRSKHLPPSRLISRAECLEANPLIDDRGVTGGILWYDCQMYNSDRVALAFGASAAARGAALANYVAADALTVRQGRVAGVTARDVLTNTPFAIAARTVVNATGPWANSLIPGRTPIRALSKAMNVIVRPVTGAVALGGVARGRTMFLSPWRRWTLGGTSHEPARGTAPDPEVRWAEVRALLADLNVAFPKARFTCEDVQLVHRGYLPSEDPRGEQVRLVRDSVIRDHGPEGLERCWSVVGVRYTTARHTAECVVDRLLAQLDAAPSPSRSATTPLDGGAIASFPDYLSSRVTTLAPRLGRETVERLVKSYGTGHDRLVDCIERSPDLARPLGPDCPVTLAEVSHAIDEEMAVTLGDVLLRRTEAGSAGHPGQESVETAAAFMGAKLGWSDSRRRDEVASLDAVYRIED